MSLAERVYKIDRLLRGRVPPSKQRMLQDLAISEPTLKRDLEYMRSRMNAPIQWDRQAGGYHYDPAAPEFNLPGMWFSTDEIHALLLLTHIIEQIQPSFLRDQLKPFHERLPALADAEADGAEPISRRVRLIAGPMRIANPAHLDAVVRATLSRRRLRIQYRTRSLGKTADREISPGRLLYYRGNWYLDAWCHTANGLRRFAVDAIGAVEVLELAAQEIEPEPEHTGYGIFSGPGSRTAVLRFNQAAAAWIRSSQWHPEQTIEELADGRLLLSVPYSEPQELLMDILRHGADVEVIEPAELRNQVSGVLESAAAVYRHTKPATPLPDSAEAAC